jgi:hypothetical protein
MNSLKIAVVKSSVYQDLWVNDITSDYFLILKTTLMRIGPISLGEYYNTDFIIVKESHEYPCQFYKNVLDERFNDNLKYSKENKNLTLNFLDETYHKHISIDDVSYDADNIKWDKYNIVICINTCISERIIKNYKNVLWCYYIGENNDELMDKLISNYDILLNQDINKKDLPYFSIGFPYTFLGQYTIENINKNILNNIVKKNGIYIEINNTEERPVKSIKKEFIDIANKCKIPILLHNQNIIENIKNIYNVKYFVKLFGRIIRGNSVLEAISAGTLVLANKNLVMYNNLILDECNIENSSDLLEKILYFEENEIFYNNCIEKQRQILEEYFFKIPINNLYNKYLEKIEKNNKFNENMNLLNNKTINKSIFIKDRGVHNIYHFLIYMISNLRHINFIPENIYLNINHDYFKNNNNHVLEILQILYKNSNIINTENIPNNCIILPEYGSYPLSRESGIDKEGYIFLKKIFIDHIINYIPKKQYSKFIYISRNDSSYRYIINENILIYYLKKAGFEIITMSNIPILEQMHIFYNSSIIVTIHGASLTNIFCCKQDIKIIEIGSKKMGNLMHFEDIAKTFNLKFERYNDVFSILEDSYESPLFIKNINNLLELIGIKYSNYIFVESHISSSLVISDYIKISLCIPTKNRFDSFLNIYLDEYIIFLENKLIDEIIICDEDGYDYDKILNKYGEYIKKNSNFKVYKNDNVLGVFLNKIKVCSYSNNEYIALIDSDNFCEKIYFEKVKDYIKNNNLPENFVLSPSYSKPHFYYNEFENKIIKKDNINFFINKDKFDIIINTGNYIITKHTIANINYDGNILNKISAGDVAYFNLQFFKQFPDFEFHVIKDLEYNHVIHNDSEYLKTNKNCNLYLSKYIFPEFSKLQNFIIFKASGRLGNALFRYFACSLVSMKYNLKYILEDDFEKFTFYQGVDHVGDDINFARGPINDVKKFVYENKDAICFNTLGFIKSKINIDNLEPNDYINNQNKHGIYVKNYIEILDNNFLDLFEEKNENQIKNKNLIMDGYFQIDDLYLKYKEEIINYINKNKSNHYITTDRNDKILIQDLIDNIELNEYKKYDIVIHIRLGDFNDAFDFIEYDYYQKLFNKINFNKYKNAIVIEKPDNEKDKLFLEKCINWFKNKNIEINVESNDIFTDFNIMKQCKILICSMSTLSWSAAYLSTSIELCYMPNYNFYNERKYSYFKKPINNTIFYNIKSTNFSKLKVLIMTLKEYPQRLKNIEKLKINLLKIGLEVDIFYGVNGKNIKIINTNNEDMKILNYNSDIYFYNRKVRINGEIMKNGELGAGWAHLNIYKKLLCDELYDNYLVLEDDAELIDNLDILYKKLNNLPEKFDVLHIAKSDWYPFVLKDKINEYFYSIEKKFFNRLTAYIVSKSGALKLLLYSNNYINIPCDDLVCHCFLKDNDFNLYVLENYLFHEPENTVSITTEINDNHDISNNFKIHEELFYVKNKDTYPPFKNGDYLEEYFLKYMINNNLKYDKNNRLYIPILWTNFQIADWFNDKKDYMQNVLNQYIKDKPSENGYFTVVQHDDGPVLKLPQNTIIYGSSSGNIILPLIYEDINNLLTCKINKKSFIEKELLCSFVGSETHYVRNIIYNKFNNNHLFKIYSKNNWTSNVNQNDQNNFIETTLNSKFVLSPRGYGRSSFRFFEIFKLGSIPIYVWDDIEWLPYKDIIDYNKICISININNIDNLENILLNINENKYNEMINNYNEIKYIFELEFMCKYITQ